MYGNKRKEKKNKKNVFKMYKATYLRALPAATKDARGVLGKFLHTKGAAKARTVYSIHALVGFKSILLEVDDRGGQLSEACLFTYRCPSLCGCRSCSNYYD